MLACASASGCARACASVRACASSICNSVSRHRSLLEHAEPIKVRSKGVAFFQSFLGTTPFLADRTRFHSRPISSSDLHQM